MINDRRQKGLAFSHLDFICNLDFVLWVCLKPFLFVLFGQLAVNPGALRCPVELVLTDPPLDDPRHADNEGFLGNLRLFFDHAAGGDNAAIADFYIVKNNGPDADEHIAAYLPAVADSPVAEYDIIADSDIGCRRQRGCARMYHAVVLYDHVIADGYLAQVAPDNGPRLDA